MDIWLDYEKAKNFNCSTCDVPLQILRNCSGKHKPNKKQLLNGKVYEQCPRSLTFGQHSLNRLVSIYFNCRRDKTWPGGGGMMTATNFCIDSFEQMDALTQEYERKVEEKHKREMDRKSRSAGKTAPRVNSKR